MGPVEVVVISFPDGRPMSAIVPLLAELTAGGAIRIADAVIARKGPGDDVMVTDIEDDIMPLWSSLNPSPRPLLSGSDAALVAGGLDPSSSALVLAIEQVWAESLERVAADSGGQLELHVRVGADVANAAALVDS
ncbi:hypothetical protein HD599_001796 [Conyzicola lurida]|uniref:Uncharacterized protein n=1 Tax=Conyzicola lurida TaxID=1172621 RepID=A0A841APF5_9MICO|nr:hypothetical protein [Conyzicola lurida]